MYVPSLDEILKNYKRISEEKYRVLYKLLFFSGIRVVEGIRMLSSYDPKNLEIKGNNPLQSHDSARAWSFSFLLNPIDMSIPNKSLA